MTCIYKAWSALRSLSKEGELSNPYEALMKKYIWVVVWKSGLLAAYLFGVNFFICPSGGSYPVCSDQTMSNFLMLGAFTFVSRLVELICYCILSI